MITASNEYGQYCVPDGVEDRPAARAVLEGRVYEPGTIRFMRANAGQGDIIHAGTFFGDFLPALSTALAPGARLWAFEPNPVSHAAAAKTIELNGLENVTLTHAAVSDTVGELLFQTHDKSGKPLGGLSHVVGEKGPGVESVPAVSIDSIVPEDRDVSIVQLDVEGHIKPALLGTRRILQKSRPLLVLEMFDKPSFFKRRFGRLGYAQTQVVNGNQVYKAGLADAE